MASPSEEVGELREKTVKEQVDLYQQLKKQLARDAEKYRREGKDRLAGIIFESLSR